MKTTVTLTAENAAAIAKYAAIVSADPAEFLNKLSTADFDFALRSPSGSWLNTCL
jgi:hypothetical protein